MCSWDHPASEGWTRPAHRRGSLLHDLRFFLRRHLGDPLLEFLQQRLYFLFAAIALVFGHFLGLLRLIEVLIAVAADVAASNLGVLGGFLDALHHLLTLFATHGRHLQADHLAVVVGRHAQIAGANGLLDLLEDAGIVRANDNLLWIRRADLGQLFQGCRRAIIFDAQAIDQGGSGPAGAQTAQLIAEYVDRFFHTLFAVQKNFLACHVRTCSRIAHLAASRRRACRALPMVRG